MSGLLAGFTASFRPTFILLFIPFAIKRKYSLLLGGTIGLLSSAALSCAIAGTFIWKRYALTMLDMTAIIKLKRYLPLSEQPIVSSDIVYPKIVEGFDWSVRNPIEQHIVNSSLYFPLNALGITQEYAIMLASLLLVILSLSLYTHRYLRDGNNTRYLFLLGILLCLASDFLIPTPRYPYYDVQMLLPLLIIINEANAKYLVSRKISFALALGLSLSAAGFLIVPKALFFSAWLIALYVAVMSFSLIGQDNRFLYRK